MGHRFGYEGTLHKSKTKHPKYYLTENKSTLNDLREIRRSHIVK